MNGNTEALKKDVADAQATLDKTHADLTKQYTSNALAMLKTCVDASGKVEHIRLQVASITNDLKELTSRYKALNRTSNCTQR